MIDRFQISGVTHDGHRLDIISLTIDEADTWSPFVRGTVKCVFQPALFRPIAPEVYASLDPRNPNKTPTIDVLIVRSFGDAENSLARHTEEVGAPVSVADLTALTGGKASHSFARLWNDAPHFGDAVNGQQLHLRLAIDEATADVHAGTMTLTIGGNELRLQDLVYPEDRIIAGRTARYVVNDILSQLGLGAVVSGGDTDIVNATLWPAGRTAFDVIQDLFAGAPRRLISDHAGKWRIVELDPDISEWGQIIDATNTTELGITLARRDWHDSAAIIWQWDEPNPADPDNPIPRRSVQWSPTYTRTRPLIVERNAPQPNNNSEVFYLAEREQIRGITQSATMPMNLTTHPLQIATVSDTALGRRATITRVTRNFPESTMKIETRERQA